MKALAQLLIPLLCGFSASGQISFRTTDVPRQIGQDYWQAYVDTSEKNVSQLLGVKGGPQRWDFSAPPIAGEAVQRMDIVAAGDGGHGSEFPQAAYAERVTRVADGCQTWSYFKVIAGGGRFYYGFHDACKSPQPDIVFDAPTIDLPEDLTFGQSWQREVDWTDTIDAGFIVLRVAIHFTNQSEVDAYGTVVLPGIGEVPALRVNEVNTYVTTDLDYGIPIETQVFRNYVWLVSGIGKAVHILSPPGASAPPENFATAKTVLRVFESSRTEIRCEPVKNLRIARKGQEVFLSWDKGTLASGYRIESCERLSGDAPWEVLAETTDNFRFDPVPRGEGSRFYRVSGCP